MDKATLLPMLIETRASWEALLASFTEEEMQKPGIAGSWSAKDVVAHISWGEREIAVVLRTHVLAGSDLWNLSYDERNELTYQQDRDRSLRDIVQEEQQAYMELLAAVQSLENDDFINPHRFQDMPEEWQPWQLIAGVSFKHYEEHMLSLRAWLEKTRAETF